MIDNFHLREGKIEFRWKRWRNKKRQEVSSCLMVLFSGAVILGAGGVALAGPTGGQVTGGLGTITNPNGTTTNINQTSNVLNINWQDFSIGAGETVNFYQPGSTSVAINRVVGGVPSYLAGALNANGRVFILNSAGITFTGTSQVNVGALLATTAMTVNGDPTQAASYSGSGYGAVINQGSISVSNGGFAILAAPYVQNTGFIKADLGTIALAGTNQFTLDLSGTGLINFVVPAGAVEKIVSDGKAVGVDNAGTLQARSGQVLISANVASEVVNAVVNLNGIVDADAFAANGQGGAVLVTSQGDINIGGQVTARGDGAGAGGQIIAKAAGGDDIKAMAYVSAVGGANGGKGGEIEVSGKQVGLHGTIKAGKGGALLIDPQDIRVVASGTSALTANGVDSNIGSNFIETHLAGGTDISLVANRDILFDALGDDHVLTGGNGNLTLTAGATQAGNILFGQHANMLNPGTQDAIQQLGGFIHMNANGGNIGSAAHAISLLSNPGTGVTAAGDIVLNAGNDIHVKDVSILSSGGSVQHALFSADAGHDFIASGNIAINAHASGPQPSAGATVNIFAAHNAAISGDLSVTAKAASSGTGDVSAIAKAQVVGRSVLLERGVDITASANQPHGNGHVDALASLVLGVSAIGGSVQVNSGVRVTALGEGHASDSVTANALANIQSFGNLTISGGVDIAASANDLGSSGNAARAQANLQLHAAAGSVNIGGAVTVNAIALASNGGGTAWANASANIIAGHDVTVNDSGVHILASANHGESSGSVLANARLLIEANGGNVRMSGSIDVDALAKSHGDGHVTANAQANIFALTDLSIGGTVDVVASANQIAAEGNRVQALANLQTRAANGQASFGGDVMVNAIALAPIGGEVQATALADLIARQTVTIAGSVHVSASAHKSSNFGSSTARASANLLINAGHDVNVAHGINVAALAESGGTQKVVANAVANIFAANDVVITGNVDVSASGKQAGSNAHFGVRPDASLQIQALFGSASIGGIHVRANGQASSAVIIQASALANVTAGKNIDLLGAVEVVASANQAHSSGSNINAVANLLINAGRSVNAASDVTVTAFAASGGGHTVSANARANILAASDVVIGGDVDITANAAMLGSHGSLHHVNATANLLINAGGNASVAGDVTVIANAFGSSHGSAQALALANVAANADVMLNGAVDVSASAINTSSGDAAAANANLIIDARNGNVYANHGIDVDAVAGSGGSHSAVANARANIFARDDVVIAGSIGVDASAKGHSSPINAVNAEADLVVNARFGNVSLDDIHVTANGRASSASLTRITALASITACRNIDFLGVVDVAASADQNITSANGVGVLANLLVDAAGGQVNAAGDISVSALARSGGSQTVAANALANIFAGRVVVGGNVDVTATADMQGIPIGSHRIATGRANLVINAASSDVSVAGDINVIAHGSFSFEGSLARASALANITARDNVILNGVVDIAASADQLGTPLMGGGSAGGAIASANLMIHAQRDVQANHGIDVKAVADSGGFLNKALATASANIFANSHVTIGTAAATANIDVTASVDACGTAQANALLQINADNVTVDGNVGVAANAVSVLGAAGAKAKGVVNAGHHASIDGAVVIASADHRGTNANSAQASALLQIDAIGADLTLNHLNVFANVASVGAGLAKANAQANLFAQDDITIASDAAVSASAVHSFGLGPTRASANLLIDAIFGRANVDGELIVRAQARASFGDSANAEALAKVIGGTHLHLGSASVTALASPGGSIGQANALASLQISVQAGDVVIDHDVTVDATADNFAPARDHANAVIDILAANSLNVGGDLQAKAIAIESGSGSATASANIFLNARTGGIGVQGNVDAIADATVESGQSSAKALAQVTMIGGDINVHGDIGVAANAQQTDSSGKAANALAELTINTSRILHVGGDVAVSASAMAFGSDPAALARANAVTDISGGGNFSFLGDIHDAARAHQNGSSGSNAIASADVTIRAGVLTVGGAIQENASATASADANANAQMTISVLTKANIAGNISIAAFAHELASNANAAKASAVLNLRAASINISRNVEITASVLACGDSMGIAEANAMASINAAGRVSLHGIEIKALADQTASSGDEALASANLHLNGDRINVAGEIRVSASAFAAGSSPGRAVANAFANIVANHASIGAINVAAHADASGALGSNAIALANLQLQASSINMTGTVDVTASATAAGDSPGIANAAAQADIHANHDVRLQSVFVTAHANQQGSGGDAAHANANLKLTANDITVPGIIDVNAVAIRDGDNSGSALANALASVHGSHNLHLGDVTVTACAQDMGSSGDQALANANLQLQGGSIHVSHAINVAAFASDFGSASGIANAIALANIAAGSHDASLNGVSVTAFANQQNSMGQAAKANAQLQLQAHNISVVGDVNVNASALAADRESGTALACALANIGAGTHNAFFGGDIDVRAHANETSASGTQAQAFANLQMHAGSINVRGTVHVSASAFDAGPGNAIADATISLTANRTLSLGGLDATVIANEQNSIGTDANAHLNLQAFASNRLTITQNVDVNVTADNAGSQGHASALANVLLAARGGASNAIDLRDVNVSVNALDHNGSGLTIANANVQIVDQNAGTGGIHLHGLDVAASANELLGTQHAHASALANVQLNAHGGVNASGHDVLVTANAFDGSSANAFAQLSVNAGHVSLGNGGTVGAKARATADGSSAVAHALASVDIAAATGNASVHGDLVGSAIANYAKAGGNAIGPIMASANVAVDAAGNIFLDSVGVTADADNFGDNSACAFADLTLNAASLIDIDGRVTVNALAHDHNGAASGATFAASANAQAHFNAQTVQTQGSSHAIEVIAHALNAGHKTAKASGSLDFGAATLVNVAGLALDVLADNSGQNGTNAIANALLTQTNSTVSWVIGSHGINVHAVADSSGTGGANAHASVNMSQNEIDINGPVLVEADAHAGANAAGGALADADLNLHANKIDIGGDATVIANAVAMGAAAADASAAVTMDGGTGPVIVDGNITANAFASGHSASANALIAINAASVTLGGIADNATVHSHGGARKALASVNILANNDIDVTGSIELMAVGGSSATAMLTMNAENGSINIANSVTVDGGTASANLFAHHNIEVGGNVALTATDGTASLTMNAENGSINIGGDLTLNGTVANANLIAGSDIILGGNADVTAQHGNATLRMKASGNISIADDVSINAKGNGVIDALFSASAGGNFAAHDVDVSASATGSLTVLAPHDITAHATANIAARHNVTMNAVHITAVDSAHRSTATISAGYDAEANLQVNAASGNIHVNGNVDVFASASGRFSSAHPHASAIANLNAGGNVDVGGNVVLNANVYDGGGAMAGRALLAIKAGGSIDLGGVNLTAMAGSDGHPATATAQASFSAGNGIAVDGNIDLTALTTHGVSAGGDPAFAHANLQMNAGSGGVDIGGNIDIRARATGLERSAEADAFANILANADIGIHGNVVLSADAHQNRFTVESGVNAALACASLELHAVSGSINIGGDVTVNARAVGDSHNQADARASANLLANTRIVVDGNVDLNATADLENDIGFGSANANLLMHGGSINVARDIDVAANAAQKGHAHALANLLANNGIDVGSHVRLTAAGSQLASANLVMNAMGGSINVADDVGVYANASGTGAGHASANALAKLQANNGLAIGGNVNATAVADQNGSGGSWARACASVVLDAGHGDVNVTKAVHASANALSKGSESAIADAFVNASAALGDVLFNGAVTANAHAEASSMRGLNGALALSSINLHGDPVVVDSIVEHATASSHGTGHANAQANASVTADSIIVNHNVDILARASQNSAAGDYALASANLQLHANSIHVNGPVDVNASAVAFGSAAGNAQANALASMDAGTGNASFNAIDVTALANQVSSEGSVANAQANLQLHGANVHIGDTVDVNASAIAFGSDAGSARANALANIAAAHNASFNGIDVTAHANQVSSSGQQAIASAALLLNAGNIHVTGLVDVDASAVAFGSDAGSAQANALANINASHNASFNGINVTALANQVSSSGQQALANANLQLSAGNIDVSGAVDVNASAVAFGESGSAQANALANIVASHNASFNGINVTALANQASSSGEQALANANLQLSAGNIHVTGLVEVDASAVAFGDDSGSAQANALANIVASHNASFNGINVTAHANQVSSGGDEAQANANLQLSAGNIHVTGLVDVDASAIAFGDSGSAQANALANIKATLNASFNGINVTAQANQVSSGGEQAQANANLQLSAGNIHVTGLVDVDASAIVFGDDSGSAQANALANIAAALNASFNGIDVTAFANQVNSSGDQALANANLQLSAGNIHVTGLVDVDASAVAFGGNPGSAQANALANIAASHNASFNGINVTAHANQVSSSGEQAIANAALKLSAGNIHVSGAVDVNASAIAFGDDSGIAQADALANIKASHNASFADIDVTANANQVSSSGDQAIANANFQLSAGNVHVTGLVDVDASAIAFGDDSGSAQANALANIKATLNASFNGIDVTAFANQVSSSGDQAQANANLQLSAGNIHVTGLVDVNASAIAFGNSGSAQANALANINATLNASFNGIDVTAFANQVSSSGDQAQANANLQLSAGNIHVTGLVDVDASAIAFGDGPGSAQANALANINASHNATFADIDVTANANQVSSSGDQAIANANFQLSAGNVHVTGSLDVAASAMANGQVADANALANITAGSHNASLNAIDVTANAQQHGTFAAGASASANLQLHAGNIRVSGAIDVRASANAQGLHTALAQAVANIDALHSANLNGIDVTAFAGINSVGADANALADLELNAGNLHVTNTVVVNASAVASGSGASASAIANALANINASHNASFAGIDVTANANQVSSSGSRAFASANLQLHAETGGINLGGDLTVNALADADGLECAQAIASANILANTKIVVDGSVDVTANANQGSGMASASANLTMDAGGSINVANDVILHAAAPQGGHADALANLLAGSAIDIGGDVNLTAQGGNANLLVNAVDGSINIASNLMLSAGGGTASANLLAGTKIVLGDNADVTAHGGNAILSMNAATGSIDIGSDVSLFANGDGTVRARFSADAGGNVIARDIDVEATASGEFQQAASATANIHAGSDIALNEVNVSAAITVIQGARFTGSHAVTANVQLNAGGSIHVNGNVVASATAGASAASGMANAEAIANLVAGGNIDVAGNIGLNAIASATSGGGGVAKALLTVEAGGLASIGGDISVTANAHAASSALANASANIVAGSLLLIGDVTGRATAIGGHGDHAFANLAMSASTGAVTVNGDIGAFAVADAASDAANASIAIIAAGAIILNGADPIASARIGPGSGTTTAFRQANHTTHDGPVTGPGGVAYANILIRGSSSTGGPPPSTADLTQIEKLFALPADTPTLNSSGGLSIIQILINGQDCGVFGSAGADANAIAKALACQKSPINVSDLTDTNSE